MKNKHNVLCPLFNFKNVEPIAKSTQKCIQNLKSKIFHSTQFQKSNFTQVFHQIDL